MSDGCRSLHCAVAVPSVAHDDLVNLSDQCQTFDECPHLHYCVADVPSVVDVD